MGNGKILECRSLNLHINRHRYGSLLAYHYVAKAQDKTTGVTIENGLTSSCSLLSWHHTGFSGPIIIRRYFAKTESEHKTNKQRSISFSWLRFWFELSYTDLVKVIC